MKRIIALNYLLIIFTVAFSQNIKETNKDCYQWLPIITNGFDSNNINLDIDFYAKKGKYIIVNDYENEFQVFYKNKLWHNLNDTLKLKKGTAFFEAIVKPSHFKTYYKIKMLNSTKEYSTYFIFEIFPFEITIKDLIGKKNISVEKNRSKPNNRLKIPIMDDYCNVILKDINGIEQYNKTFDLPQYPYLDYSKIPLGTYILILETYNYKHQLNLNIYEKK